MSTKQLIILAKVGNVWDEFMAGYKAAIDGALLEEMQTKDMAEGWCYANKRDNAGEPTERAIEDDNVRHSRGMW